MATRRIYRVHFLNQGQVYEVYARQVSQGALYGFVELEELLFGEKSQVVVDPSEERLQTEFKGVSRVYVPMHLMLRIDEVEEGGASRIRSSSSGDTEGGKVTSFPGPVYTPGGPDGK